jgi:hypothetical protein
MKKIKKYYSKVENKADKANKRERKKEGKCAQEGKLLNASKKLKND